MGFIIDTSTDFIIEFVGGILILVIGTVLGKNIKDEIEKSTQKWGLIILFLILFCTFIWNYYHGTQL